MMELDDAGEVEPYKISLDQIWRSTDPRARARHQVCWISDDGEEIALAMLDANGAPVRGQIFSYPAYHLIYGEAFEPDTSGLPAPFAAINGRLVPIDSLGMG